MGTRGSRKAVTPEQVRHSRQNSIKMIIIGNEQTHLFICQSSSSVYMIVVRLAMIYGAQPLAVTKANEKRRSWMCGNDDVEKDVWSDESQSWACRIRNDIITETKKVG